MKKIISLVITLMVLFGFTVIYQISKEENLIVGTWISKDEPQWKWVFNEYGKCFDYYNNQLSETYKWSIETTSPQCGQEVPVGEVFSYLILVNVNDPKDEYCYEIFSLDEKILQIRYFNTIGLINMRKQD